MYIIVPMYMLYYLATGSTVKETIYLINNEDSPYQFKFIEKTCLCENPKAKLIVSPMSGTIDANQKLVHVPLKVID